TASGFMLQKSGPRRRTLALGRAYFGGEIITSGLLSVCRHRELQFRAKPDVLENRIFVRSPEFVTYLACHGGPGLAYILSAHPSECRIFSRLQAGRRVIASFQRAILYRNVTEPLIRAEMSPLRCPSSPN